MALNVPVFLTRTASSVVFVIIMLAGLLWNDVSFVALFCMIGFLCLHEYFKLMERITPDAHWPQWLKSIMLVSGFLLTMLFAARTNVTADTILWSTGKLLPVMPILILIVVTLSKRSALMAWLQSLGGLLYITLPVVLLIQLHMQDWVLPVALIFMIWSNDTLAYLTGSFFGKHPLSPISPKKTWEGTLGGALLTLVAAMTYGYFSHKYRLTDWLVLGLCATVAGSFGDLLESKLKRMAGVKDSGNIMPGHGGALDRFDSLIVAAPFAFLYASHFMR